MATVNPAPELKTPRTADIREMQRFFQQLVDEIKALKDRVAALEA